MHSPFPKPVVRRGGTLECWQLEARPHAQGWRVRRELLPAHQPLAAAWSRLACARREAATRRDLLLVLAQTCGGAPVARALPLPPFARGGFDLRPWLDDPAAVRVLLRTLAAPEDDPYLLAQHRVCVAAGETHWSSAFAQTLLPWLRGLPLKTLRATEEAVLVLAPWPNEALTAMVCGVASGGHPAWLSLAAQEPAARRALFLERLLHADAFHTAPPRDATRLFTALRHLESGDSAARDLDYAFTGLRNGAAPSHLAESLRLGRATGWEPTPAKLAQRVPIRAIGRLAQRVIWHRSSLPGRCAGLWALAGALPGSGAILHDLARRRMSDRERRAMVCFLEEFVDENERTAARLARRWQAVHARWASVLAVTGRIPPSHRSKAWDLLGTLVGRLRIESEPALLDEMLALTAQVCRPPFDEYADAQWSAALLCIAPPSRRALLDPGAKAWRALEKICANDNRKWLLDQGLSSLRRAPEQFVAAALREHPRAFLNAVVELGILRKAARAQVWRTFAEHPTVACDLEKMPLHETLVLLDAVAIGTELRGLVPEPLRARVAGTRPLEPHRLAHYRAALPGALARVQIEVLRGLIERELWRGFPVARPGCVDRHTIELAHALDKNRAPLRRLIRTADITPPRALRTTHPRNRTWLAAQRLAGGLWDAGDFTFVREIASLGAVTLAFEDDPQAVFRMGTVVGSCLSLGGANNFAAVANAFDANKRVLFARDATGRFLARQLLAISEERTLVCFRVYPDEVAPPLAEFFRLCDHTLAQMLCLPLQSPRVDYQVTPLVCADWYDDGVWEE